MSMETNQPSQVPQVTPSVNEAEKVAQTPVTEDKFKENFERIAKQEKFQAEQRKRLEADRLSMDKDRESLSNYQKIQALKSEDPLKALELLGLSLDEVVKAANNPKNIDPVAKKALEAVEKLQAELAEEKEKAYKQKLTKVEQELTANIDSEIKAGEYDLIEQLNLSHTVREYMEEIFDKTGEIVDIKDACSYVNNYLASNIKKVLGSKWLKEQEKKVEEVIVQPTAKPTLTNKMTSEAPKTKKLMSEDERMAEAIKALSQAR